MRKSVSNESAKTKTENQEESELSILESHHSHGNRFYYEEHNYEMAIKEYEMALESEKDELIKMKITYQMAESYVKLGKLKKAIEIFQILADNHKQHHLNDSARKRIKHLYDYLVEKEEK